MKNVSRFSALAASSLSLVLLVGCGGEQTTPTLETEAERAQANAPTSDVYADVLQLANSGQTDVAIEKFVNEEPENWIASSSLQVYEISESEFGKLSRAAKNDMQQRFIDHVGEIKTLSRAVVQRANELNRNGDVEAAKTHIDAVHRLGQQLQDADIALVLQMTGTALSRASLDE